MVLFCAIKSQRAVLSVYVLPCSKFLNNLLYRFYSETAANVCKKDVSPKAMVAGYQPNSTESGWYEWWDSKGYFKPSKEEKLFTVLLPPPNVTGSLHLGHALTITIQDVILRWMRMKNQPVLWIPGFDHAGIATQAAVEKYVMKLLNLTKYDLGKNEFVNKIEEWRLEKEEAIIKQMKQIGASVDWSKKYFTLDSKSSEVVVKAFIHLHSKGLIYRAKKHVTWSCFLRSSVSETEIDWKEINHPTKINVPGYEKFVEFGYLYDIAYKICNSNDKDEEIVVSTTRPETLLGDTAVAVHPEDIRYSHLKDKFVWHPFRNCKIPIVFDTAVDRNLGTGAVKITPAHSPVDYEIASRCNLELMDVITDNGYVREVDYYSKFQNMKRFDARISILDELHNLGLYKGKTKHASVIPICSRSGDIIEYMIRPQWFMKTFDMLQKVSAALKNDNVDIEPHFCKEKLLDWLNENKDWNLSRQLWWGHQIPMYECTRDEESLWVSAASMEEAILSASRKFKTDVSKIKIIQDPDVLDTWFSSGVLPLTLSGWPNMTHSRGIYPLGLMETGMDIAFCWVARMLMLGLEIAGELPFRKIFFHGMVCDAYGRKMSKSVGNVVLPENIIKGISLEEMKKEAEKNFRLGILSKSELKLSIEGQKKMFPLGIPECGADALRFTLCTNNVKNEHILFNIDLCKSYKFFCNKMWQSVRYLQKSTQNKTNLSARMDSNLSFFDSWILGSLANTVESVDRGIRDMEFHLAVIAIRNFLVKHYCDIYLESTKDKVYNGTEEDVQSCVSVMFNCMETILRLVCPFMPFVAEELYHCLPKLDGFIPSDSITITKFPDCNYWAQFKNPQIENLMLIFIEILTSLRSMRSVYKLSNQKLRVILSCSEELEDLFSEELIKFWKKYTFIDNIEPVKGEILHRNVITRTIRNCTIYLYHQHTRCSLREIFASTLAKETSLMEDLEKLKLMISQPHYEEETPELMKKKNLSKVENITADLKYIEELKDVIEKTY